MREVKNEVNLNVSSQGLELVLEYIYTSKLQLNLANIQNVLSAASYFQLEAVMEACLSYLTQQLDIENCIDILTISEIYSLTSLKQKVYRFICGHLFEVSRTNEFQRLTCHQLQYILACDFPVDCTEANVLRVVVQWLVQSKSCDISPESLQLLGLLRQIRFSEMSLTSVKQALTNPENGVTPGQELYKIVLDMARAERKKLRLNHNYNGSLVNLRGMELALIKIGGFDLSGITNEITYCFPNATERVWRYLTSIPHIKQSKLLFVILDIILQSIFLELGQCLPWGGGCD